MKKKKPSSLNQEHINILQTMENLLQDTDETFSQSCMRYGEISDDELLTPMQENTLGILRRQPKNERKKSSPHGIKDLLRMKIYSDLTNKLLKS
jgi:hypothetical protein